MRRVLLRTGIILLLVFIAVFPFWDLIYANFNLKTTTAGQAQLSVKSIKGNYDVYLDGKKLGNVKDNEQGDFLKIESGKRNVRLVRLSDVNDFFFELSRTIIFIPGSLVEITWDSGPTLESSSGTIKYFSTSNNKNSAELLILPFPNAASVEMDGKKSEQNLFQIADTVNHTVKISNGNGFESQSIQVNLTDVSSNKPLVELRLIIEVYLYKQPFK